MKKDEEKMVKYSIIEVEIAREKLKREEEFKEISQFVFRIFRVRCSVLIRLFFLLILLVFGLVQLVFMENFKEKCFYIIR